MSLYIYTAENFVVLGTEIRLEIDVVRPCKNMQKSATLQPLSAALVFALCFGFLAFYV